MQDDLIRQLGHSGRQNMRLIWEISGLDETKLSSEDRTLLEAMRLHPEYYDLWERLDEVTDEELQRDGTNPVLHVIIHQIVENQVAANDPPETAKMLERLRKGGLTRHEALHKIGGVVTEEIFEIMKFRRVFDEQRYLKKLGRLGRSRRRRLKRRR